MTKPFLTIGMATYDDYHGTYFTIQHIRLMFPELMDLVQFVCVDNNPDGPHGKAVAELFGALPNGLYIPFKAYNGTAVREEIFKQAAADHVLCLDCHVLLAENTLHRLFKWFDENQDTNAMVQGPIWFDQLDGQMAPHLDPVWSAELWGIWGRDERGENVNNEPYPIGMHGLGLFAMQKRFWPGLNPLFRGFGGEEGYVHEKVRQRGGQCLCLPGLRWVHRFGRPGGPPYPNNTDDRIRNFLLGHIELGLPIDPILDHFKDRKPPHSMMLMAKAALEESIKHELVPAGTKIRMMKAYEPSIRQKKVSKSGETVGKVSATFL